MIAYLKIKCTLKIYDAIGNKVIQGYNEDLKAAIIADTADTANQGVSVYNVDLYWNGYASTKMRVAPGVYKAFVYIEYYGAPASRSYKNLIMPASIGITR